MSIFNQWPWTNFNDYNLDWVIKKVQSIEDHISELVIDATSDILDATLTDPDKAAQAKVTGDRINLNAGEILGLKNRMTVAEGKINTDENNITDLQGRMTDAEGRLTTQYSTLLAHDGRITTNANGITALQGRMTTAENALTAIDGRVDALEAAQPAVFTFSVYYDTTSLPDPFMACSLQFSPNTLATLLANINSHKPIVADAEIQLGGIVRRSRIANLTTVASAGVIHGVEFDAGEFHCKLMDTDTVGSAYYKEVVLEDTDTPGVGKYTKGDYVSIAYYNPTIDLVIGGVKYKPLIIDSVSSDPHTIDIYYYDDPDPQQGMRHFTVDDQGNVTFS